MIRVVLASKSPARLATLRAAGIEPLVMDAGVDESAVRAESTAGLVAALARLKGEAALEAWLAASADGGTAGSADGGATGGAADCTVLVAADTLLDLDGTPLGKPGSAQAARRRLAQLSGACGVLHTGHYAAVLRAGQAPRSDVRVASTQVRFAVMGEDEMDAYAASGEPEQVAGAFTIDGLGGAFIEGITGDPHNVVGLSLPLLRLMLAGLGVVWTDLWQDA